jgi:valyl-tRNA synthetase
LELSKGEANIGVLIHALRTVLKLLHPYCPFVTEAIWAHVQPQDSTLLMQQPWPVVNAADDYRASYQDLDRVIQVITAIRKLRTDQSVDLKKEIDVTLVTGDATAVLQSQQHHICRMAKVQKLTFANTAPAGDMASAFLTGIEVHLSLEGLIDKEKEKTQLTAEQAKLSQYVSTLGKKLSDEKFTARAPAQLVESEKKKLQEAQEKLKKIEARLSKL